MTDSNKLADSGATGAAFSVPGLTTPSKQDGATNSTLPDMSMMANSNMMDPMAMSQMLMSPNMLQGGMMMNPADLMNTMSPEMIEAMSTPESMQQMQQFMQQMGVEWGVTLGSGSTLPQDKCFQVLGQIRKKNPCMSTQSSINAY